MKWIKYQVNNPVNIGTEENPIIQDNLIELRVPYDESVTEAIEREAYGKPSIYDDGQPEPEAPEGEDLTADEMAAAILEGVSEV